MTQGLFLEIGYNKEALYTLKDNDYLYEGKIYPSIKRLYLLIADPTEYEFASTCLLNWKHWLKMCESRVLRGHIDEWREELEVKLRSKAVEQIIHKAEMGNLQAAKFLADRGWDTRGAGRPTKAEIEGHKAIEKRVDEEYSADIHRLGNYK